MHTAAVFLLSMPKKQSANIHGSHGSDSVLQQHFAKAMLTLLLPFRNNP